MRTQVGIVLGVFCLVGCQQRYQNRGEEVLCEKYVHKYGIEVPVDEWAERGQNGVVVAVRRDGVKVSSNYVDGVLHGEVTYTYPNSAAIKLRELYREGALEEEKHYDVSGAILKGVRYLPGGEQEVVYWYEGGEPQSIERWKGQLLISSTSYTEEHGEESRVEKGSGTCVRRDGKGKLLSCEEFLDGHRIAKTEFYSNGTPSVITPERGGKVHGTKQSFYDDGAPRYSEEWRDGVRHGMALFYQNGALVGRIPYVKGVKDGTEERYRDGEEVISRTHWEEGKLHGAIEHYFDGKKVAAEWYYHDRPVTQGDFDMRMSYRSHAQSKE